MRQFKPSPANGARTLDQTKQPPHHPLTTNTHNLNCWTAPRHAVAFCYAFFPRLKKFFRFIQHDAWFNSFAPEGQPGQLPSSLLVPMVPIPSPASQLLKLCFRATCASPPETWPGKLTAPKWNNGISKRPNMVMKHGKIWKHGVRSWKMLQTFLKPRSYWTSSCKALTTSYAGAYLLLKILQSIKVCSKLWIWLHDFLLGKKIPQPSPPFDWGVSFRSTVQETRLLHHTATLRGHVISYDIYDLSLPSTKGLNGGESCASAVQVSTPPGKSLLMVSFGQHSLPNVFRFAETSRKEHVGRVRASWMYLERKHCTGFVVRWVAASWQRQVPSLRTWEQRS